MQLSETYLVSLLQATGESLPARNSYFSPFFFFFAV